MVVLCRHFSYLLVFLEYPLWARRFSAEFGAALGFVLLSCLRVFSKPENVQALGELSTPSAHSHVSAEDSWFIGSAL